MIISANRSRLCADTAERGESNTRRNLQRRGLNYSGEPGCLNEATSDIFGTDVEFYADNSNDPGDYPTTSPQLLPDRSISVRATSRTSLPPPPWHTAANRRNDSHKRIRVTSHDRGTYGRENMHECSHPRTIDAANSGSARLGG